MTFTPSTYSNFVSAATAAQERLFLQYIGPRDDFDIVIVGSGIGGGVLADDLADRAGAYKRILVLEAGSCIYPTHVYNICRFPNANGEAFRVRHVLAGGKSRGTKLYRREAAAEFRRPINFLVRTDSRRAGLGARFFPFERSQRPPKRPSQPGRGSDERVAVDGFDRAGCGCPFAAVLACQ